jgi:hypothetical protein
VCQRRERDCVMQFQQTILERLGKTLRGHDGGITHEALPRRWVELIHFLDEQERKQSDRQRDAEAPRR